MIAILFTIAGEHLPVVMSCTWGEKLHFPTRRSPLQ